MTDVYKDPMWLKKLAATAYKELSALPPSAQPTWFRVQYGDMQHLKVSKEEKAAKLQAEFDERRWDNRGIY